MEFQEKLKHIGSLDGSGFKDSTRGAVERINLLTWERAIAMPLVSKINTPMMKEYNVTRNGRLFYYSNRGYKNYITGAMMRQLLRHVENMYYTYSLLRRRQDLSDETIEQYNAFTQSRIDTQWTITFRDVSLHHIVPYIVKFLESGKITVSDIRPASFLWEISNAVKDLGAYRIEIPTPHMKYQDVSDFAQNRLPLPL